MKLTAKIEYACLAMLHLAEFYGLGQPVQIRCIAEKHGIPSRFLVQILLQIKAVGLVNSTRGASGGYRLSRPPHEISLADILEVMEGEQRPKSSASKTTPLVRTFLNLCDEIDAVQRDRLEAVTLSDLVDRAANREPMWYI